jgi:hypothetical protein
MAPWHKALFPPANQGRVCLLQICEVPYIVEDGVVIQVVKQMLSRKRVCFVVGRIPRLDVKQYTQSLRPRAIRIIVVLDSYRASARRQELCGFDCSLGCPLANIRPMIAPMDRGGRIGKTI